MSYRRVSDYMGWMLLFSRIYMRSNNLIYFKPVIDD